MGDRSPAIVSLSVEQVATAIQQMLDSPHGLSSVRDYVTSIDWSNAMAADDSVRSLLGEVEEITHAFDEGELVERAARRELGDILFATGVSAVRR